VLNALVAQVVLKRPGVAPVIGQLVAILAAIVLEQSRLYLAWAWLISSANTMATNSSSIGLPSEGLMMSVAISLTGRGIAAKAMTMLRCAWVGMNGVGPPLPAVLLTRLSFLAFRAMLLPVIGENLHGNRCRSVSMMADRVQLDLILPAVEQR
jgi:hypothetical protein